MSNPGANQTAQPQLPYSPYQQYQFPQMAAPRMPSDPVSNQDQAFEIPAQYGTYPSDLMYPQSQSPQPPQYTFMRRINRMNWDMIGKIDVSTIAKTGDTQSVEYLMAPIAFANITPEDTQQFGSRACLHAFLLLQMAVELLMNRLSSVSSPISEPQKPQEQNQQIGPLYEARIDLLNKDIRARDLMIQSLTQKLQAAEKERDETLAILQSHRAKKAREPPKSSTPKEKGPGETGADHFDTEYMEYLANRPEIHHAKKTKRKEKRQGHANQAEAKPVVSPMPWDDTGSSWN